MEKTFIATGTDVEKALESALDQLGLSRDEIVTYSILSLPSKGFLGFGAKPAKIQVVYEIPDPAPAPTPAPEAPKSALSSASRSKPKAVPVKKPEAPKEEAPKAEAPKAEAPKAEATEAPKAEEPKPEAPKADAQVK